MKRNTPAVSWLENPTVFGEQALFSLPESSQRQPLNTGWKLHERKEGDEGIAFASQPQQQARQVQLPFYQSYGQGMEAWYAWDGQEDLLLGQIPQKVSAFCLQKTLEIKNIHQYLLLEEVRGSVFVYVNDHFAGMSKHPTGMAAWDLASFLQTGSNTLSLYFYPFSSVSWLEGYTQTILAGCQAVWLQENPDVNPLVSRASHVYRPLSLTSLELYSEVDPSLEEARVYLLYETGEPCQVHAILKDPKGKQVLEFTSQNNYVAMDLVDLQLWSPERPQLYTLELIFENLEEQELQKTTRYLGLRLLDNKSGALRLNGKPFEVRGLVLADDFFDENRDLEAVFLQCRQLYVNTLFCRRPFPRAVLEAADQYGVMLVENTPWQFHEVQTSREGFERQWKALMQQRLENRWQQLQSYACLLAWQITDHPFGDQLELELGPILKPARSKILLLRENQAYSCCLEPYSILERALQMLEENWDTLFFFKGEIRLQALYALEEMVNFGGFFVNRLDGFHHIADDPRLEELYCPYRIELQKRGLRLVNRQQFTDTSHLELIWKAEDGKQQLQGREEIVLEPGSNRKIFIPWKEKPVLFEARWEYKKKNHSQMLEHANSHPAALLQYRTRKPDIEKVGNQRLQVVRGQGYAGVFGQDFQVRFSRKGLEQIWYGGQPLLQETPLPVFFHPQKPDRADRLWLGAWDENRMPKVVIQEEEDQRSVLVRYDYTLPVVPAARFSIIYTVASNGTIGVDMAFQQSSSLVAIPYFGLQIPLHLPQTDWIHTTSRAFEDQPLKEEVWNEVMNTELIYGELPVCFSQVHELLEISSGYRSFLQRKAKGQPHDCLYLVLAPNELKPEPSDIKNDALRRYQFSFMLFARPSSPAQMEEGQTEDTQPKPKSPDSEAAFDLDTSFRPRRRDRSQYVTVRTRPFQTKEAVSKESREEKKEPEVQRDFGEKNDQSAGKETESIPSRPAALKKEIVSSEYLPPEELVLPNTKDMKKKKHQESSTRQRMERAPRPVLEKEEDQPERKAQDQPSTLQGIKVRKVQEVQLSAYRPQAEKQTSTKQASSPRYVPLFLSARNSPYRSLLTHLKEELPASESRKGASEDMYGPYLKSDPIPKRAMRKRRSH